MAKRHDIRLIIEAKKPGVEKSVLKKVAQRVIELEGIRNGVSLNLFFTDNKRIRELNRRFLNRDEPTDVLSFGLGRGGFIGEVAISVEMAEYNARRFNTSKKNEIFLYVIHGVLHLLGYEDKTEKERRVMENRQNRIMMAVCGNL